MKRPRTLNLILLAVTLAAPAALLLFNDSLRAGAQENVLTATDSAILGIDLYKNGKDQEAVKALKRAVEQDKHDIAAWHYLALAYSRLGKTDDARKAHEKAAKSGEWRIEQLHATLPYGEALENALRYRSLLVMALESTENYLRLASKLSGSKAEDWEARADLLRDYTTSDGANKLRIYKPSEVTTKAKILYRPEATYTEEARQKRVRGTIVIRAVLAADRKVRGIAVLSGLPNGLTLNAVRAARRIRFEPAILNGAPVSQAVQIEYNFNIY